MEMMERRVGRSGAGEAALWVLGEVLTFVARTEAYTLLESAASPGSGLPPHVHLVQDEAIYVMEGEYTLARPL